MFCCQLSLNSKIFCKYQKVLQILAGPLISLRYTREEPYTWRKLADFQTRARTQVQMGDTSTDGDIDVRYHCGGRPMKINACVLNSYMVYL
jgi:hypothetical protein